MAEYTPISGRSGFEAPNGGFFIVLTGTALSNKGQAPLSGYAFKSSLYDEVTLKVDGLLKSFNASAFVASSHLSAYVEVGANGLIRAKDIGIEVLNTNFVDVSNEGRVIADRVAFRIEFVATALFSNDGFISARVAIEDDATDVTAFANQAGATIKGAKFAYIGGEGDVEFGNYGLMIGDVDLGGGDDSFANIGAGRVKGWIHSGDGTDTIIGQEKVEKVFAGDGFNSLVLGGGKNIVKINGNGQTNVTLGANDDTVTVFNAASVHGNLGGGRDKVIYRGNGTDFDLDFGDGNDLLIENRSGSTGNIYMGVGNDRIIARNFGTEFETAVYNLGDGNDRLVDVGLGVTTVFGDSGVDRINGGKGDDIIDGGDDRDILRGGAGNDKIHAGDGIGNQMFGGGGEDTFILYDSDNGSATIRDFQFGKDQVLLDDFGVGGFTVTDIFTETLQKSGRDAVFDFSLLEASPFDYVLTIKNGWNKLAHTDFDIIFD